MQQVKTTEPKIDTRSEQHYAGIRAQIPSSEFENWIPKTIGAVFGWLGQHGVKPDGIPFMRYHVINMPGLMDVEVGVPVAAPINGDDQVKAGALPAGRYASLIYTGVMHGREGNKVLIDWAEQQGLKWDRWDVP